jgi:hypothetical protein
MEDSREGEEKEEKWGEEGRIVSPNISYLRVRQ